MNSQPPVLLPTLRTVVPESDGELASIITSSNLVLPHGGQTKPPLSTKEVTGGTRIDLTSLTGIVEYEPEEFVFTALAGTRINEITTVLKKHGQFLPFDPPFSPDGATIGGTVASGMSGPGRLRYGGVRDFIIGIKFIDSFGKHIMAGGKVVKNSAGFDFPKLFVGSLGRLGVLYEITFKVFPRPTSHLTLSFNFEKLEQTISSANRLAGSYFEAFSIDISPPGKLDVRIGGDPESNEVTATRITESLGHNAKITRDENEAELWKIARDFDWAEHKALIKIPITTTQISELDIALGRLDAIRRYSAAGNVAYASVKEQQFLELDSELKDLKLSGLALKGNVPNARIGHRQCSEAEDIVQSAMNSNGRFLPLK